jgi:hypothetical protein
LDLWLVPPPPYVSGVGGEDKLKKGDPKLESKPRNIGGQCTLTPPDP